MRLLPIGSLSFVAACSAAAPPPRAAPAPHVEAARAVAIAPAPARRVPGPLPEAVQAFAEARVTGTLALLDSRDGVAVCSDPARCEVAVTPASTFKIPHSIVALETGVVEGPDTILPWDGSPYTNAAWNQDLSLRDAFRFSCVPCFQAIARKVGEPSEREWLHKLAYGNESTEGGAERFWLDAGLLISPLQQLDFLRRFDTGKLPISERTADLVKDIMTLDVTESYVLRGKTGTVTSPDKGRLVAWLVGWLERDERRVYFATLIDGAAPGVDATEARRPLTERVLRGRGLM